MFVALERGTELKKKVTSTHECELEINNPLFKNTKNATTYFTNIH